MSDLKIITNNVPRDLLTGLDLTEAELANFDYLDDPESNSGFFRYRGVVYNLDHFTRSPIPEWDGIYNDSYFSGILVRLVDDTERVIVGLALC